MVIVRSTIFNIFFFSWLLFILFVLWVFLPFSRRLMQKAVRFWAVGALWGLRKIVGLFWVIEGHENIPTGPAVFASKHQSAWETFAYLTIFDDPQYALKKELMEIPFWGWYARKCGMIEVNRKGGAGALKSLVENSKGRLLRGGQVIIFPEGTRVAPGEKRPYFSGVAALYLNLPVGVPLIPIALNSGQFWGRRSFEKKPGTIRVSFLPAIPTGLSRREMMLELENRIEAESDRLSLV